MKIKLVKPQQIKLIKNKVVCLPFFSEEKIRVNDAELKKEIDSYSKEFYSLEDDSIRLFFSGKRKLLFVKVGGKKEWSQRKFLLALRNITLALKENRLKEAVLFLDQVIPAGSDLNNLARQIPENILMADYDFIRYKEKPKQGWPKINSIEIGWSDCQKHQVAFKQGLIVGEVVNFVRDLGNIPGGEMTPQKLALAAQSAARKVKNVKVEIFEQNKLKKISMGGILGVAQGSSQKPKFIILKYFGRREKNKIDLVFVGKGVTFDTGGLDIKPFESMKEGMYMDMSGGAAVLGAVLAIAKLKTPLNIIGLIPAVENMPSGQALRPGDLLKAYNGKTIEVISTDAEGRIILADALSYAVKNYKPKMVIDLATLTGAAIVALGYRAAALFTNFTKIQEKLVQLGEKSGDFVWPLPCWEEYDEEVKGTFGDIANLGKYLKYGGAINGASFLKAFVEKTPWVHIDISPTMTSIENQGLAKGATGVGVRYLVQLAQDFPEIKSKLN